MSNNAGAVTVATTGKLWTAPIGTPLPTTAIAVPNTAFAEIGYISDAGVVESQGTSTNKIKAWQNGDVVREVQTEHDLTYKFGALEDNATALNAFYGNYTAGLVEINGLQPGYRAWILDIVDGLDLVRIVVPYAQVSDRGDITYVNTDAITYDMTITAFGDPNYSGGLAAPAKAYRYDLTDFGS